MAPTTVNHQGVKPEEFSEGNVELVLNQDRVEHRLKRKKISPKERLEIYKEAFPLNTKVENGEKVQWRYYKPEDRNFCEKQPKDQ